MWQIYPQAEDAHLVKLEAFLERYLDHFEKPAAVRRFWHAWNTGGPIAAAWRDFATHRRDIERHGRVWVNALDQTGDLAHNLMMFAMNL